MNNTDGGFEGVIVRLERLRLSANGNPRFKVYLASGDVRQTQTDASINYEIENPEYRDVPVLIKTTRAGRIYDVQVINKDA